MTPTPHRAPRPRSAVKFAASAARRRAALAPALLAAVLAAGPVAVVRPGAADQSPSGLAMLETGSVTRFLDTFVAQAIAALSDQSLPQDQRDQVFRAILLEGFDTDGGARFVLGRGWRIATPEQRAEFVALFRKELLRLGKELFEGYEVGEILVVQRVRPAGAGKVMAETKLTNPAARITEVDFLIHTRDGRLQIVDVELAGFSLRETYRREFVGPLFEGGVEQVLRQLRRAEGY